MIRRFFKDTLIYSLGPILTRGIQIILLPLYTRILTPSEYGIIDLLNIIASFVNITVALEITQGFARYYSEEKKETDKILYSSTSFWFVLFMYGIFLTIAFAFSGFLNRIIIGEGFPPYIFQTAIVSVFFSGLLVFLQNQLRFYLKSKLFVIVSIVFTLVSSVATIILLLVFKAGITGYFIGAIAGYAAAVFLSWYFARDNYKRTFDWAKCKEMLSFSIPLVPGNIGVIILMYVDRISIKHLMTLDDVGVFGRAYSFAALITIVLTGFQTAIMPLIYQSYKESNTPKEIAKIFRYFLAVAISFILALSIFSIEALKLFTTPAYFGATSVIPFISFATLFLSVQFFTPGLALAKKTKVMATINIAAAILNTILCFLLIPVFGIMGAGLSTFFAALLIFGANMYFSQKLYYIPHKWNKIISAFVIVALFIYLILTYVNFSSMSLLSKNLIKAALWIVSTIIIIKILIGYDELKEIFKLFKARLSSLIQSRFNINP